MRIGSLGPVAAAFLLLAASAHAAGEDGGEPVRTATLLPDGAPPDGLAPALEGRCAPPCGYINPLINMEFPEKPRCGAGQIVRPGEKPEDCIPLMEPGGSIRFEGTLQWYWEISEEGHYLDDPFTDILVSFSGTASNPSFLTVSVEPDSFTITSVDLFHPERIDARMEDDPARTGLWYWFEEPITVTFTRTGDPTPQELDRIQGRDGIQGFFLKASSSPSSDRFKEAFGVEEFRFDAHADPSLDPASSDRGAPGPGLLLLLGAVAAAALMLRRRR